LLISCAPQWKFRGWCNRFAGPTVRDEVAIDHSASDDGSRPEADNVRGDEVDKERTHARHWWNGRDAGRN